MFSIIIPTWNNLAFLRLCIEGIQRNSAFGHQVILHVNEGMDGTREWARQNNIEFTYSETNVGICDAVNQAAALAKNEYIVFMNDDMYPLPGWDDKLMDEISQLQTDCFMLSATMIEPFDTGNKCVIVADYGRNAETLRREKLLNEFSSLEKGDWSGSTWPPSIVRRNWWNRVGGYSLEFSPGMASDNDFAMKMWQAGCRIFKGVGASRIYHFVSKSTGRIVKNNGRMQFLQKWGIKQSTFDKYYLHRGKPYTGMLSEPGLSVGLMTQKLMGKLQRMFAR